MRHTYLLSLGLLLALTQNILMQTLCGYGYIRRKGKCVDDNECESNPSICGENANCFNTDGSYYCQCDGGFTPTHNFTQADSIECKDINECVDGSTDCGSNAKCTNHVGGYFCTCETGYISSNGKETFKAKQGVQCIDRDECDDPSFCGKHAACHNSAGSFYCICDAGFRLKSGETNFTDTNQLCESVCEIDKSICGGGVCKNSPDGHECVCNSGFTNYGHKQMKCTELNCDALLSKIDTSQAPPQLVSLLTSNCLAVSKQPSTQRNGETFLEKFLSALDDLLRDGLHGDKAKVSAMFSIVERMLKLIGPLLSKSQTRRSNSKTDVEMLVKRGSSPPEGHFLMNISGAQLTSNWDTATGNNHLGFTTAAILSYEGLEKSLNSYFNYLETKEKQTFKINSKVVTATVSNQETAELKEPVNLTFSHLEKTNEEHICVFWDHTLEGGAWSTNGCTTVNSSADQTVCSCSHLSSFAVLMALYDIGTEMNARRIPACVENMRRQNTNGSFYCICDAGFRLKSGETNNDKHELCEKLNCDTLLSESKASQASPKLTKLVSLMTNSCLVLSQSESVQNNTQVDGEKLLKEFLSELDDLPHGGFRGDNYIISALFRIVIIILKLIGHLLSASRIRKISAKADVELLVKRGSSPPEGHFLMNISGAQMTSHWDTATRDTYLGFTSAVLLSYKGLEESLNCCFNHLETEQKQTFKINSKVVTATFSNYETKTNLTKPVNLTFSHLKRKNEKHICVFWDPELEGGAWSTRGCITVRSRADQTVCSCYKLGSFAVLTALCDTGVCMLNFCQKGS
ncbi:adhesion G protein-coupled receptor E2 [Labeo rohita]|uniref:adhesion G protein-coupled receptor E2 n=1 Tax=Labeo rohita TaxID=84645 RepID=UPI0021E1E16E|nr:adhesion G protein-coupled receptor E2 [Labeo rohita]